MKLCMLGTGYVGLVSGVCFADIGNQVVCVDKDKNKIDKLNSGISPIYEPGLDELIKKNFAAKRLSFTTDINKAKFKKLFVYGNNIIETFNKITKNYKKLTSYQKEKLEAVLKNETYSESKKKNYERIKKFN